LALLYFSGLPYRRLSLDDLSSEATRDADARWVLTVMTSFTRSSLDDENIPKFLLDRRLLKGAG
jgi:hypothetical protein